MGNYSVVVLDFETTGLSPYYGDMVIEIGAVLIQDNRIVDRYQSLMNPGMRISSFIENYTGITNRMLGSAPGIAEVMEDFYSFIAQNPLVAHNAGFDSRFLDAEFDRINKIRKQEFACSMLVSRRLYPDAPNHKLETLVRYKKLKTDGVYHRALADAEMTGHLWIKMIGDIKEKYNFNTVTFDIMRRLSKVPKAKVPAYLSRLYEEQGER
jgi:DNA polymerase-3 subunit epsilon